MANPWDNDPIVAPASNGQKFPGVIHGPPITPKAPDIPSGYRQLPNGNLEAIKGGPADPLKDMNAASPPGDATKTGEDYLKTLDPAIAGQVKMLASGRLAPPSSFALRSPYWQSLLQATSLYDPSFDAINFQSRAKTRAAFTSGKEATQINALNTAIGHIGQLWNQINGTWSTSVVPFNEAANWASKQFLGDSGVTNYENTETNLASELTRVWRGTGGNEADVKRYIDLLSENHSEGQKRTAIQNLVGLMQSKLEAFRSQYEQGMGTMAQPFQELNKPSYETIDDIMSGRGQAHAPNMKNPNAPAANAPQVIHYDANGNRVK